MKDDAERATLLERQRELESNSLSLGSERFRRRVTEAAAKGRAAETGAALNLLQIAIDPLELAIQNMIDNSKAPGQGSAGGRSHEAVRWCKAVGADVAAYMTAKVVLNGSAKKGQRFDLRDASLAVTELIVDELRFRKLEKEAPGLFKYRIENFATRSYPHRKRTLGATIGYAGVDVSDIEMSTRVRLIVGAKLVYLFTEATGLVELILETKRNARGRPTSHCFIQQTPETVTMLEARNELLELLSPLLMPMVVPPLPWGVVSHKDDEGNYTYPSQAGGYLFALRPKFSIVRRASGEQLKQVERAAIPIVYEAVNLIQGTAWKINAAVVDIIEAIVRKGGDMAGIPKLQDDELPSRPLDIAENEEARKKWRQAAGKVKDANAELREKRKRYSRVLAAAKATMNEAAIYFPHNLDFRGRVYPIAGQLTPQGNDLQRALLTFANARPVGSDGGKWLAIHGANCLGDTPSGEKISRMTFAERIDWIDRHSAEIQRVASDPFSSKLWVDADKPLQFYAFCVEWSRYVGEGRSQVFESSLPVYQDGTCNGLQHFAALLKDQIGGAAVNLTALDAPQDIYQRVAYKVLDRIEELAATDWYAAKWLSSGLVGRKLTKKPVMTWGYGSERYGFREQIIEHLQEHEEWEKIKEHFTDDQGEMQVNTAANKMAEWISDSLPQIAPSAEAFKVWAQTQAKKLAELNRPVCWTVPITGFPVRMQNLKSERKQVETVLGGKITYRPSYYTPTDKILVNEQKQGMTPNFVHSLDAAALMLAVTHAATQGVESFGVIHDSYATVAGDYSVLAQATRQGFYRLHTGRPIEPRTEIADVLADQRLNDLEAATAAGIDLHQIARERGAGELSAMTIERIAERGFDKAIIDRFMAQEVSERPVAALYRDLQAQMDRPEDCDPPPELDNATLDPGEVLVSEYFFA